jgi:hypothetical protein
MASADEREIPAVAKVFGLYTQTSADMMSPLIIEALKITKVPGSGPGQVRTEGRTDDGLFGRWRLVEAAKAGR